MGFLELKAISIFQNKRNCGDSMKTYTKDGEGKFLLLIKQL